MGTTLSVMWRADRYMYIAHVGDSRIYRLRENKLEQITEDHSIVAELMRNNVITPEMAKNHPYKNVITRAVGIDPAVVPDVFCSDKRAGDLWLVCSDGLYNMVGDEAIAEALDVLSQEAAADRLLELALDHGGTDNISFVICRVTEVAAQ